MAERITRITVETERVLIVARQHSARAWCEKCGGEVEFLPSHHARRVLDVIPQPPSEEHRKQFHLDRDKGSGLAVCLKSLLRFLESARGQRS